MQVPPPLQPNVLPHELVPQQWYLQVAPIAHVIGVPTQELLPLQKISQVLPFAHVSVVLSHT